MRKRIWFACLLAMSMTFAACGSKASTEVEQEDAATVQEDTPEAEEDTTQEEENTDTITPEESQEQTEEVQDPTVTETPEDEEAQKNDTAQEAPQDVTPVNAQYQVYAGTYYDMNIYEATAEGKGEGRNSGVGDPGGRSRGNGFAARISILTHNNEENKNNYVQNKDFTKYTFHMDGFVG